MHLILVLKEIDTECGSCGQPQSEDDIFGIFSAESIAVAAVEMEYHVTEWKDAEWNTDPFSGAYRYAKSISEIEATFYLLRYKLDGVG